MCRGDCVSVCDGSAVEDDGDRAVIDGFDLHIRAEDASFDVGAEALEFAAEGFVDRFADPAGGSRTPTGAAALARVGVQRELADHQDRGVDVGGGLFVAKDAQIPDLAGQSLRLVGAIGVGDTEIDQQTRFGKGADNLPVHTDIGPEYPLNYSLHCRNLPVVGVD